MKTAAMISPTLMVVMTSPMYSRFSLQVWRFRLSFASCPLQQECPCSIQKGLLSVWGGYYFKQQHFVWFMAVSADRCCCHLLLREYKLRYFLSGRNGSAAAKKRPIPYVVPVHCSASSSSIRNSFLYILFTVVHIKNFNKG